MNYGVFRWDLVYFGVYTDRSGGRQSGYFTRCHLTIVPPSLFGGKFSRAKLN